MRNDPMGAVYVQSNESGGNQLLTFGRGDEGTLVSRGALPTGGSGDGLTHLPSQGSVTLSGDQRHLLVTNAGSGDVSMYAVGDGTPSLLATMTTGMAPKSVAEHDGLVYVLNTGVPSLAGFRLHSESMEAIPHSMRRLDVDADPAQVGFSPDGTTLAVTERGSNAIATFPVDDDGRLGDASTQASSGPTPYGFAFSPRGPLVVVEAFGAAPGKAAASSYVAHSPQMQPVSRSVGNGRSEVCWATVSPDGKYVFTTNFADSAVSRYAVAADGQLTLDDPVAAVGHEGHSGLRDEDLSDDGRYLYAIDADAGQIFGWSVGSAGTLAPLGSWDGLPTTAAGLAAN